MSNPGTEKPPAKILRVLLLEDVAADVELMLHELENFGYELIWDQVQTGAEFSQRLSGSYDVVLVDYQLPGFNGLRAIDLVRSRDPDVPLLVVSGWLGDEGAAECIRRGANDYVLKAGLGRLGLTVARALEERQLRLDRRHAEEAKHESEVRFRQLAENIEEVFWMTDPRQPRVLYVSPAYEKIWGRSAVQLYAHPQEWLESVVPEDRERVTKAVSDRQPLGTYDEEYRILRPDQGVRWIHDRAFPIKDATGEVYRVVGVAEDVTAHKQLEMDLLRAQRMQAVGALAGGVAHDLNNILAPILLLVPMLRSGIVLERSEQIFDSIETTARRGADLIRQLLEFARGADGAREKIGLSELISEIAELAQETFPKTISLVKRLPADGSAVVGHRTELHQVVLNLCLNARDAMPDGGVLTLAVEKVNIDETYSRMTPDAHEGPYVLLKVSDTGRGVPAEILARIFEPFFTTKSSGRGAGLGLSTVREIVRSHGGFVQVQSGVGQGTTFSVYLPASPQNQTAKAEAPESVAMPTGRGETLLIVDDEETVLEITREVLSHHGYRVLTARDGIEAITRYNEEAAAIKMVVTDLDMPLMGGITLIKVLKKMNPNLKIIVSSGMAEEKNSADRQMDLAELGLTSVLVKPYAAAKILAVVKEGLTSKAN